MDWMQFVSALASALAWPAAVVTVVCLLKNPILGLIPKIRSFKYGELHVDLTEELKAVQESLPSKPQEPPGDEKGPSQRLLLFNLLPCRHEEQSCTHGLK